MGPAKPYLIILAIGRPPTRVGSSEAPNIATERGRNKALSDWLLASAVVILFSLLARSCLSLSAFAWSERVIAKIAVAASSLIGFKTIDRAIMHLVRAIEDTEQPCASEGACDRRIVGGAHGAKQLYCPVGDVLIGTRDTDLDQRNLLPRTFVAHTVEQPGGLQYHEPRLFDLQAAQRDPFLDSRVVREHFAEGMPILGALQHERQ